MINKEILDLLWASHCDGCCRGKAANFRHDSWCGNFRCFSFFFLMFLSFTLDELIKNTCSQQKIPDTTAGPDRETPEESEGPAGPLL